MSPQTFDSQAVYDEAAGGYAELSERLWGWAAAGLAERAVDELAADTRVLDCGCGPGGVAVRAARLLGPGAAVTAVDQSAEMLERAREHADVWGARNIEFTAGDMGALDELDLPGSFDAVTAGLSLFLAPDIPGTAAGLWQRVGPGGSLAVSAVSEQFFSPAFDWLHGEMVDGSDAAPDIPWRRIDHPDTLRQALREGGVDVPITVEVEIRQIPLDHSGDFTAIMHGTGIHGLLASLPSGLRDHVEAAALARLERSGLRTLAFGVIYAIARKRA